MSHKGVAQQFVQLKPGTVVGRKFLKRFLIGFWFLGFKVLKIIFIEEL